MEGEAIGDRVAGRVPFENVERVHCAIQGHSLGKRLFSPHFLGVVGCKALVEYLPGIHGNNYPLFQGALLPTVVDK